MVQKTMSKNMFYAEFNSGNESIRNDTVFLFIGTLSLTGDTDYC